MNYFPIKVLTGIETKFDGTDQDRGTLRRADAVLLAPQRALSSGPTFGVAWGYSALATSMATALSGADTAKVHFATIADAAGNKWLIAWDLASGTCRGLWNVAGGTSAPNFASASGVSITATNNTTYRDKTAALFWYGTWIGQELWLGNGTDTNLLWTSGALALLGPSAAVTDLSDPSQFRIPACTSFAMDDTGRRYAAGNVTNPLRIWRTDPPTTAYPSITGVLTNDRSFCDINRRNPQGSAVTGLSPVAGGMIAHLGAGGAVFLSSSAVDGNLMAQHPLNNEAGAVNPACIANANTGITYFGSDFELYQTVARAARAYGERESRDAQIETRKSSGQWNRAMYRNTVATAQPFILHDTLNDRVWIGAPLALRTAPGLYAFDRKTYSVTGPFHYPKFTHLAPLFRQDLPGATQPEANGSPFVVLGVSTAGALLYADLGKVGELALDAIGTAIGASYEAAAVQPTPTVGLTCIGVYGSGQSFARVDSSGNCDLLADVWGDWASNGTSVPAGITEWYNNASLAIVELAPEDYGTPVGEKDFCSIRLQWRPNQRVYAGMYVRSGQQTDGLFLGTPYPDEEQVAPVEVKGTRLTLRLALVFFNGAPAMLPDLTVGLLAGGPR